MVSLFCQYRSDLKYSLLLRYHNSRSGPMIRLPSYFWGRSRSKYMLRSYPLGLPEIYYVLPVLVVKRRHGVT